MCHLHHLHLFASYVACCGTVIHSTAFSTLRYSKTSLYILFTKNSRNHIAEIQKIGFSLYNFSFKLFRNLSNSALREIEIK